MYSLSQMHKAAVSTSSRIATAKPSLPRPSRRSSNAVAVRAQRSAPYRKPNASVDSANVKCLAEKVRHDEVSSVSRWDLFAASLVGPLLLGAGDASAANGNYGILEGKSVALIHPFAMITLFGASLYAGYLGLQWRRLRTVSADIKSMKQQLPPKDEEGKQPSSPLEQEISQLESVWYLFATVSFVGCR
mmetsp:Transcript_10641/g.25229  ORF Transcript_10641/g.25229 Transcript_10641/m.25229 type:complete len:189 (-) Transcript_10641:755-1321(-)